MSPSPPSNSEPAVLLTPDLLRTWPLPDPSQEGDKRERGTVLIVGGSVEMPGAVILAGTAALRAGAGRLRLAVPMSIAPSVAAGIPEARVYRLPESPSGALGRESVHELVDRANAVDAVLLGPGLLDEARTGELLAEVLPRLETPVCCLDAAALSVLKQQPGCFRAARCRGIATPHLGEMAGLCGRDKADVQTDSLDLARRFAAGWGLVLALKGAKTTIVAPDGRAYENRAGNVGLATGGSGDVLAGIIAGLAGRGAEPVQAAAWGVHLHAVAGDRLAKRIGPIGFLAREILPEIPGLLADFSV